MAASKRCSMYDGTALNSRPCHSFVSLFVYCMYACAPISLPNSACYTLYRTFTSNERMHDTKKKTLPQDGVQTLSSPLARHNTLTVDSDEIEKSNLTLKKKKSWLGSFRDAVQMLVKR